MLGGDDLIGFVSTADPERARRFYEDVLGLKLCSESPYALVFDANGMMLRVTTVAEVAVPPTQSWAGGSTTSRRRFAP